MKPEFKKYVIAMWVVYSLVLIGICIFFSLVSMGKLGYMPSFRELENPKSNVATEIISADGAPLGRFFVENRSFVDFEEISPYLVRALIDTEDERFYEHSGIDFMSLGRVLMKTVVMRDKDSGGGSTITQQLAKLTYNEPAQSFKERIMQKFCEWVISVKLERSYTKEEILAMYFNRVAYVYDAYGIESASYTFFGKKATNLKVEEAAVLVGMLKNPALYNPKRRLELVTQRRNVVLGQMLKQHDLSKTEFDSLKTLPLDMSQFHRADHKDGLAPYFREFLRIQMSAHKPERENYASWREQDFHDDSIQWATNPLYGWIDKNPKPDGSHHDIYRDGLKIYTTIDSRMQRYAEEAVAEHVGNTLQPQFFIDKKKAKYAPYSNDISKEQYDQMVLRSLKNSERWRILKSKGLNDKELMEEMKKPVETKIFDWKVTELDTVMSPYDSVIYHKHFLRCGFMAMEPGTGHIRAYVGGPNFRYFQYDMAGQGRRQVGSTIKPFIYTQIMRDGHTPCDLVPNSPQTFLLDDGTTWTPRNAGEQRLGEMVSIKWGLANSNNNVTGWAMKQMSPQIAAKLIHDLGIESHIDPVWSLFLGTSEVKLIEMVGAYGAYVNKGVHTTPIIVTRIEDRNGNQLARFSTREREVLDEQTSFLMINLLQGVVNQGTACRLRGPQYRITSQIGGKTGTTQNQSDGWFMAVLPHLVCGTWVGGEERAIHFNNMKWGQAANMAIPVFGKFLLKVYADERLTSVRPTDEFEKPATITFSLDCADRDISADEGEGDALVSTENTSVYGDANATSDQSSIFDF